LRTNAHRHALSAQWDNIHGREFGKLFAPVLLRLIFCIDGLEQHWQAAPCCGPESAEKRCGAWVLRSLVAYARRRSADIPAK
jgi:hypothetical protein